MNRRIASLLLSALLLLGLLAGCGGSSAQEAAAHAEAEVVAPAAAESPAAPEETADESTGDAAGKVAGAEDMTEVVEVLEEGMVPIGADALREGVWPVEMKSSSSMFKADHCEILVENGEMQAVLYMTSEAYLYMYAGTATEAAAAPEAEYITLESAGDGLNSFTLPLEALDAPLECAAYSRRKELWYDRTLLFRADSLPLEAFAEGYLTTAESLDLADGEYSVEVTLSGGSGRASIQSPARLLVQDGEILAEIVWSSSKYDFMMVDGEKYLPVNTEGNAAFLIPVSVFDHPMAVQADTTAMSQPHLIDYSLRFDSATVQAAEQAA